MIERGIFQNPFAFEEPKEHSSEELLSLLWLHLDHHHHYSGQEPSSFSALARFFKVYVREFRGTSEVRVLLHEFGNMEQDE
ncbi:hypothetical protein EDO6_02548 [Paenibacillus xylanexedens]|nr:hypothetical protein EDO6_02548 [Paenibacillus xylanexedens]